jgi:hypothetical protein
MKKLLASYALLLLVLDLAWATTITYFGKSVITAAGVVSNIAPGRTEVAVHAGGHLIFFFAFLQSLALDFIFTIALVMGLVLYATFFPKSKPSANSANG